MGAEVIFELWQLQREGEEAMAGETSQAEWYIRVLYLGQPLQTATPLGVLDMIELDQFLAYLDRMLPADPVAACQ